MMTTGDEYQQHWQEEFDLQATSKLHFILRHVLPPISSAPQPPDTSSGEGVWGCMYVLITLAATVTTWFLTDRYVERRWVIAAAFMAALLAAMCEQLSGVADDDAAARVLLSAGGYVVTTFLSATVLCATVRTVARNNGNVRATTPASTVTAVAVEAPSPKSPVPPDAPTQGRSALQVTL